MYQKLQKAEAAEVAVTRRMRKRPLLTAAAAEADMRVVFTTDIHGQVVNYDYQSEQEVIRGLNKAYTLVKKQEVKQERAILLHLTWETVCMILRRITYTINSPESLQPVYNAMSKTVMMQSHLEIMTLIMVMTILSSSLTHQD